MATTNTKIETAAKARLPWLCNAVQAEYSVSTTQEEIVSALVVGTSVPQLVGLLMGYKKATAQPVSADPADPG